MISPIFEMTKLGKKNYVNIKPYYSNSLFKKAKEEFDRPNEETVNYLLVDVLERKNKRFCYPEKLRIAEEGETLMLMDGSRSGKVFRSIDGAIGSTLAVLRLKDERLSREFLYQYLKYREKEIISKNTGSAIPHANKSYIFFNADRCTYG